MSNALPTPTLKADPPLDPIQQARFSLEGEIGRRLAAVTEQWILPAPFANPKMIEMFRRRDRKPYQEQVPWAGEFAGKYLTHMVQIHRLTRDPKLGRHIAWFIGEFIRGQDADGYLGPWPTPFRFKRNVPTCGEPWDTWGHYHAMLGLLLWHRDTGDAASLACARRIADYMCKRFLNNPGEIMHQTGAHEMNQAPIHSLTLLHTLTGERRYLDLAKQIEREFELPPAGDYLRCGLDGREFAQTPKPRWESLHPIMGLSELWLATGEEKYKTAFVNLWWSMVKGDRHNNGGFTSGEQATGNPYDPAPIETCCTIAWMAMSVEMLRLTGESVVADEIELALVNSGVGMMSPSGRWVTYNTPMDGARRASAHDIVFQARSGSPELNCCSVNGPRALGMICEWAVMKRAQGGLALNYFGPGVIEAPIGDGKVTFTQRTDYPRDGRVDIAVSVDRPRRFPLALRIPYWSEKTGVKVNGEPVAGVTPGRHLVIDREWRTGDRVELVLDFSLHFWAWRKAGMDTPNWETTWRVFGPAPRRANETDLNKPAPPVVAPTIEGMTTMPTSLTLNWQLYKPREVVSKDGVIAGRELWPEVGGLPTIFAFTNWASDGYDIATVRFTADWWCTWYCNGEVVYDTFSRQEGNKHVDFRQRLHEVRLPLNKGDNLIAVRVGGGSMRGAWLSIGRDKTVLERNREAGGDEKRASYLASVYRGPVLLTLDPRFNEFDIADTPALDAATMEAKPVEVADWLAPWMVFEFTAADGRKVRLTDFASAGNAGYEYNSWLSVIFDKDPRRPFTRENPLRSARADA